MITSYGNYVDGEWVESESGDTFDVTNPTNVSAAVSEFQAPTADDTKATIAAANAAEDERSDMPGPSLAPYYETGR